MASRSRQKLFQVDGDKIQNLLFCDNSDTEDTLQLDEEDLGFLENDVDHIAHNVHAADLEPLEVVIEPPIQYSTFSSSAASDLQTNEQNLCAFAKLSKKIKYRWKKIDPISEVSSATLNNNIEFKYGQILLPFEKTATPFEIFKKVSKFDQFLIDIMIPQTSNLTFNKCLECNIHLCFVNSRNCFQTYHDSL